MHVVSDGSTSEQPLILGLAVHSLIVGGGGSQLAGSVTQGSGGGVVGFWLEDLLTPPGAFNAPEPEILLPAHKTMLPVEDITGPLIVKSSPV